MRRLRTSCRLKGLALHFEIGLHVDFGGFHVHVAKEILHHHERNAGLKKVHAFGVPHGMGADCSDAPDWAWNWRLGASTSAECIARRVGPTAALARSGATALGHRVLTPIRSEELTDELSRLWQQRAQTFASSFAT